MTISTKFEINGVQYDQELDPRDGSLIETEDQLESVINYLTEQQNEISSRPLFPGDPYVWNGDSWVLGIEKPDSQNEYVWDIEESNWKIAN